MRVSLSGLAQADAEAAIAWYVGEGAYTAADDFANALDTAFELLSEHPYLGKQAPHHARILTLHSFPYSLIYRIQDNEVRIIAVAHHSRRPGYWTGRR